MGADGMLTARGDFRKVDREPSRADGDTIPGIHHSKATDGTGDVAVRGA